jgi:hypothetical protein
VVLGDRDQGLTLKRLMASTAKNRWGRKPATESLPSTEPSTEPATPSGTSSEPADTQSAESAGGSVAQYSILLIFFLLIHHQP